jgi:hypothetical protein
MEEVSHAGSVTDWIVYPVMVMGAKTVARRIPVLRPRRMRFR